MNDHTRAVQERRRSNAAGAHGTEPTRAELLADALDDYADDLAPDDEPASPRAGR